MLTRQPFYYGITRKIIVGVGGLFNNIFVRTRDVDNITQKIVKVPISYANKEKYIVRLNQDPSLQEDIQILLPRMSYEIVGFDYDSDRQLNKNQKCIGQKDGNTVYQYAPVPYNITIQLYSYTRTQEDNLQILEQILPYFTPNLNLSIKVMQNPDVTQNCDLILNSVNTDDQYDGGFEDRRYIITTYVFMLKMNYYGPMFGTTDPEKHFADSDPTSVIKRVITNINNNKYTAEINPFDANKTDNYTILENWDQTTTP